MEEDNDDQWLYGEDSTTEKPAGNDESTDRIETDVFSEKGNEAFINPPDTTDENTVSLHFRFPKCVYLNHPVTATSIPSHHFKTMPYCNFPVYAYRSIWNLLLLNHPG